MNPQGIYATTSTKNVGFSTSEYQLEFTDTANSLSWDGDMSAYALGYINPDQLPNSMAISKVFITEEKNVDDRNIVIQRIKPTTNAQITFVRKSNNTCSFVRNDEGTVTSGNLSDFCFINNLYPEFIALTGSINITIKWFLYVNGVITNYITHNYPLSFDGNNTYYSWLEFKNDRKLTENFGQNGTVEFGYSDFDKGRFSGTTSTGAEVTGFFVNFTISASSTASGYNSGNYNYALAPLLNYSGSYEYGEISGDIEQSYVRTRFGESSANAGIALYQFNYNSGQGRLTNIYDRYGYGDDVFNVGDLKSVFMGSPVAPLYTHIYTDTTLVVKEDYNPQVLFCAIRDFDEIDQCLALYSRFTSVTDPPVSYLTNKTYCCDVDANNKFSIHFKTGDINDASFKAGLRPWQYIDRENPDPEDNGTLNTNEFDPEDPEQMPPYTPEPGPEPENPDDPNESPEEGDPEAGPDKNDRGAHFQSPTTASFPVNPSPFVEYGIFDYSDLVALSVQLWNKPDSFFEALAGEQKVNPMDYFISLKWYPFELAGETQKDRLYLGSGGELVANYVQTEELCRVLDWGSLKVQPYYNNFLDYDPYTKVFIYLPLCGQVELNSTIVMGKTIELTSVFDVAAGSLVWIVWNGTDGQPVLMKQCSIGSTIPISGVDAAQMSANIVNATLQTINNVAKAGGDIISAAAKGGEIGSAAGVEGTIIGGAIGAVAGGVANATNLISTFSNLGMASKEIVQLTGGTTGLGASGIHTIPAIIYQRPLATNPSTYGETVGFICNKTARIGSMSGFTMCKNSNTNSISGATEKEKAQIKKILDSGFFV